MPVNLLGTCCGAGLNLGIDMLRFGASRLAQCLTAIPHVKFKAYRIQRTFELNPFAKHLCIVLLELVIYMHHIPQERELVLTRKFKLSNNSIYERSLSVSK